MNLYMVSDYDQYGGHHPKKITLWKEIITHKKMIVYRLLLMTPFYVIDADWAMIKCGLAYLELKTALEVTNLLSDGVDLTNIRSITSFQAA